MKFVAVAFVIQSIVIGFTVHQDTFICTHFPVAFVQVNGEAVSVIAFPVTFQSTNNLLSSIAFHTVYIFVPAVELIAQGVLLTNIGVSGVNPLNVLFNHNVVAITFSQALLASVAILGKSFGSL